MFKFSISFIATMLLLGSSTLVLAGNSLDKHPSPYLAMHAEDPVDWRIWEEDVFQQAREQNRLIFVSVGYFSCHWCHVMQRESYQDKGIAETLNEHFLAVKIDRELRPELDRRLIEFVSRVRGSAGWPLNVFLTPEGYPVTGFTYLPKDVFGDVILQLQQQWATRQVDIENAAKEYHRSTLTDDDSNHLLDIASLDANSLGEAFVVQAMQAADELQGGFGDAAKFPQNPQLLSLFELVNQGLNLSVELTDFLQLSLREMASRHLMDHLHGGFFRYTTDPDWQTPHYEKMLYDNAQMVLLYLQAEQMWPGQGYAEVAETTLAFMQAWMKHPQGGYVSSLSAVDIDGREGGGYLWRREELKRTLGKEDFAYVAALWQFDAAVVDSDFLLEPLVGLAAEGDLKRNQQIKKQLQRVIKPIMPVDNKRLASWNALVLQALVAAAKFDKKYQGTAEEQYKFMRRAFFNGTELMRFAGNHQLGESTFEDYAFVANAFQQYGELLSDQAVIKQAHLLASNAFRRFYSEGKWNTSERSLMPKSPGEWLIQDSVIPSPLTQWLAVAFRLRESNAKARVVALEVALRVTRHMLERSYYYGSLIALRHRQSE